MLEARQRGADSWRLVERTEFLEEAEGALEILLGSGQVACSALNFGQGNQRLPQFISGLDFLEYSAGHP